jgi:anaerobic ribonucleoside-triphosphate reductase
MDQGLFPYTKRYLGTLRNHFSTLGVNGINEMVRNFTDDAHDITSDLGHAFAVRLLDHVRERMTQFQEETGHLYNLEATPAEGTTYRFAKEDKKRWPAILQAGTAEQPYYTNSSQLPVGFYRRPVRGPDAPGGAAVQIHRRHRAAPVHGRAPVQRRGLPRAGAAR